MKKFFFKGHRLLKRYKNFGPVFYYRKPKRFPITSINRISCVYYSKKEDSVWNNFLRIFKENIEKDESLQEDIEILDETTTMEILKKTYEMSEETGKFIYEKSEPVRKATSKTIEKTGEQIYSTVDNLGEKMDYVAEQKIIKGIIEELNYDYRELQKAHYTFRSSYARKEDEKNGIYFNPYTKEFEKIDSVDVNEDVEDLVVSKEGETSEKKGFFKSISEGFFKPTEQSLVFSKLRQNDENFDIELFIGNVENILIPKVLDAFFRDDKKEIRRYLSDGCYKNNVWPFIQERVMSKKKFNTKVLSIENTYLASSRFVDNFPVIILGAKVQYIHCVEDENGDICEGGTNDIRTLGQFWGFRQDPSGNTKDWEIFELVLFADPLQLSR